MALLGMVAVDYILAGHIVFLFGWLLPHGAIEIPAILIAGQGGLVLGRALIGRGDRAPLAARLRAIGPDLMMLIYGVAVMLVWVHAVERKGNAIAGASRVGQPRVDIRYRNHTRTAIHGLRRGR